jgi:hypothetical protein
MFGLERGALLPIIILRLLKSIPFLGRALDFAWGDCIAWHCLLRVSAIHHVRMAEMMQRIA